MSTPRETRRPLGTLDVLVEEARSLWVPPVGALGGRAESERESEAERQLLARVDAYESRLRGPARFGRDAGFWRPVAAVLAVAAGAVFFARSSPDDASIRASSPALGVLGSDEPSGSSGRPTAPAKLAATRGNAEVRVEGVALEPRGGPRGEVARGVGLADGQRVEAHGGDAVFSARGRVDWLLESETDVVTERAGNHGGAIILALRSGAVEAQVTPVAAGEAFAVDVDGVRVAVHGTHLRVARDAGDGTRVLVDLSEGVISVGTPPKAGATVGLLVTAPAHVEFRTGDLSGTLRVDHDPSRVRAGVDVSSIARAGDAESASAEGALQASAPFPSVEPSVEPTLEPSVESRAEGDKPPSGLLPSTNANNPGNLGSRTPGGLGAAGATGGAKPPTPTESILAAIRVCADQTLNGKPGTLTIRSTLTVDVKDDGLARLVSFDPPLVQELQTCVATTVYSMRWAEPGSHRIPIELHR